MPGISCCGFKPRGVFAVTVFLCLLVFDIKPARGVSPAGFDWPVKVLILNHVPVVNLVINRPVQVTRFYTEEYLGQAPAGNSLKVSPESVGIVLGDTTYMIFGVNLSSGNDERVNFSLDNRDYRGRLQLIREADMTVSVINQLSLEEYLAGVLPGEVPSDWPRVALEAQAIAARTYALYQAWQRQDKDFHLQADIRSQVYGGAGQENGRTTAAVKATKGKILTYNGYIFPAYFHAACGGHRQSSLIVWGVPINPLKGGSCSFCSSSPHQLWQTELSASDIQEKISEAVQPLGPISSVKTSGRDRSGRVVKVEIIHSEGTLELPADKFRMALGFNQIKSTNFNVVQKNNLFVFTGHGWGHGVGLCQWGAAEMARQGYSAEQILNYYYPSSKVTYISDYIK